MRVVRAVAVVAIGVGSAAAASCAGVPDVFRCTADEQCRAGDAPGLCEVDGFCSQPDTACGTGRRYAPESADKSGACVEPWLFVTGGPFADTEPVLALDRAGRLHLGVSFVDQTRVGDQQILSAGLGDFYLAELDPLRGRLIGVEAFGSAGYDELHAIARYGAEDILVAASIEGAIAIDGATADGPGMMIARRGTRPWAGVTRPTAGYLYPTAISEDGSLGRVVVAGAMASFDANDAVIDFGVSVEEGPQVLIAPSTFDSEFPEQGFVAMFEGDGRIATAQTARANGSSGLCEAVAVDPNGVLVATCLSFAADDLDREDPLGLAQISASWQLPDLLSEFESNELTSFSAIAYGPGPALFVAGTCFGACALPGASDGGAETIVDAPPGSLIVVRATADESSEFSLVTSWVGRVDAADGVEIYASAIAPGPDGRVYVTGGVASGVESDVFVATFDPSGALVDYVTFGGSGYDWGRSIVVGDAGEVFVAGSFRETMTLRGQTFVAGPNDDIFVMRL